MIDAAGLVGSEGERGSSVLSTPGQGAGAGPLAPGQRWSLARKHEVVLRLLRGEPVEAVSRQFGVPVWQLERWQARALAGLKTGLRERSEDPAERELAEAHRRIRQRGAHESGDAVRGAPSGGGIDLVRRRAFRDDGPCGGVSLTCRFCPTTMSWSASPPGAASPSCCSTRSAGTRPSTGWPAPRAPACSQMSDQLLRGLLRRPVEVEGADEPTRFVHQIDKRR